MLNRRRILAIILFIIAGLIVYTFANPSDEGNNDPTQQELLDGATEAVEKAEDSLLQADVDKAVKKVDELKEGDDKDDLDARLDAVQAIINATNAVKKAEESQDQDDVDAAKDLVNGLPNGDVRNDLNNRLDEVQAIIDEIAKGNEEEEKVQPLALDTTKPVITLLGVNPTLVVLDGTYTEKGATATDNVDGTLTGSIVITGTVDTNLLGSYSITYKVSDKAGNTAIATRIVKVVDATAPVITIGTYNMAPTNQDVVVTATTSEGTLNTNSYTFKENGSFTFTATDASGNITSKIVTITNIDKVAPSEPTLVGTPTTPTNGNVTVTITYATDTASKEYSFDKITWLTYTTALIIDANKTVYARGIDAVKNISEIGSIAITNIEKGAPVITVTGTNPASVNVGSTYTDEGATAIDDIDGNLGSIIGTNTVNTNVLGTYVVTYTATDAAGNIATATRTVIVKPIINFYPISGDGDLGNWQTHRTFVEVEAGEENETYGKLNGKRLKYLWTTSSTVQPTEAEFDGAMAGYFDLEDNQVDYWHKIWSPVGLTGTYYLWVMVKDADLNETYAVSAAFNLDNTAPLTPTFAYGDDRTLSQVEHKFTITVTDNVDGSGIDATSLRYLLIKAPNSGTKTCPSLLDGSWDNATLFTNGVEITSRPTDNNAKGNYYICTMSYDLAGNGVVSNPSENINFKKK